MDSLKIIYYTKYKSIILSQLADHENNITMDIFINFNITPRHIHKASTQCTATKIIAHYYLVLPTQQNNHSAIFLMLFLK